MWPLQFRLTRDIITMVGAIGFVSIFASFAIWWERKVAGRIQSRLGPMRVGGWHGWAQSIADGLKLVQKEDICLEGADRRLFFLAPYIVFVPALTIFLALPFSAAWVGRDLDVGLILIFAMLGVGVVGVLLGGWASNDKWSMFGAMREACQMISYEIPLGFSLLVPLMIAGTIRLTTIGDLQAGGFWTWLAFSNPFAFVAAVIFFIATLASCKRAPFDLPEAESELVAGYMTEYSGFRWALFMFAEYAEMFAVGALGAILFFGAWHSPLPASWGAELAHGPIWQQALHGLLFSGPLWLIAKGFFFVFVQIWLRWTLPRIRIDQVMYTCIQVLLPLALVILLGNTFWGLWVRNGSGLAIGANVVLSALGVILMAGFVWFVAYGFLNRRVLVGTLAVDHLPGA
ncbi:MAG: NADH-quinone oxidoreductase subunit NuoH [Phycisphaerae bacterium]|nr:NADH-quinone oxidoreductase subunit NuoH [Phycisphaerae bacterium]